MRYYFLIFFVLSWDAVTSQEVPVMTEQQLENLGDENMEDDALLQQLAFYHKHPINLNTATTEELYLLRLLTDLQIQSLLQHRTLFGKLLSIYELQAVPGFDLVTIKKILPFVYAGEAQRLNETLMARLKGGNQYMLVRFSRVLEASKGYDTTLRTHYLGDRNHLQLRYSYQYKNLLYYGLVADKDAGEQFFKGAQKAGFDFYSLHFFARNLGHLKALAVGDYALNLGQGLTQWHSLGFGKSADVINIKRQAPVLLPYRSAGEFFFNRGAAATLQWNSLEATAFISYKNFSGNLAGDSADRFSSFGISGYHRTRLEIEDRNKLTHFSAGGNLSYNKSNFKLGLNAITHRFSLPIQKQDEPYNQFAIAGKTHTLFSADYSYTVKNMHVFGEVATDVAFHTAIVQGAMISVDAKLDLSFFYRNISKGFQSPFGNAFTESTLPSNENGFYSGIQVRPATGWQFSAYGDFYRFPFLKFRVSSPTRGWDYLAQLTYVPEKRTEIYLRFRSENKPLNSSGQTLNYPVDQKRKGLRVHLTTPIHKFIMLKARTELVWFENIDTQEEGFLTYVETAFEPWQRLKGNVRLQYFETGGFNSRIYAYESDVLYSFSIPGFFEKGYRYYLNLQFQASEKFACWLRIAQTNYANKRTVGSGLDQIDQRHKTDFRLQLRYQFN